MTLPTLLLGLFAAAVFAASFLVHVCSFVPGSVVSLDRAWVLHIGAMAAFVLGLAHVALLNHRWRALGLKDGEFQPWLEKLAPVPARVLFGALFVYAIANFAIFAARSEGSAVAKNGRYVLERRGKHVRDLTDEEYRDHRRLEVRGPSGHWMLFSAVPAAYLLFLAPRARAVLDAPPAAAGPDPGAGDRPSAGVV